MIASDSGSAASPSVGPRRASIRVLLLSLVLSCLLPGVIGIGALLYRMYRDDQAQTQANAVQMARSMTNTVDAELAQARAVALALATSTQLAASDLAGFHKRARELLGTEGIGENVVLSDADGQQVLNTLRPLGQALYRHGDPSLSTRAFDAARPRVSDLFVSNTTGLPIVAVDVPVTSEGRVRYGLSLVLAPKYLGSILHKLKLPGDWVSSISDRSGTIVARSIQPERFVGSKVNPELLRRLAGPPEGAFETVTKEGVPALLAFSRSPTTGWTVAIAIPAQSLAAPWLQTMLQLGLGATALFAVGGAIAWRQGGRVSRSVDGLKDAALAMAAGQPVPTPQLHFAEAERAAQAIAQSARNLGDRDRALQVVHEALLDRKAQLTEAQRMALLGSWYRDAKGGVVTVSDSMRLVFGHDALHPFCEPHESAYLAGARVQLRSAAQGTLDTGLGCSLELQALRADGAEVWVEARTETARSAAGAIVGLRGTVQDITTRKQAEEAKLALQKLGDENRQILTANRVKSEFLANMSHELRTPLNAIIGFAELLHSGAADQDPAKRRLFLGHIGSSGRHLLQLINDVLDLAKVESGKFEFFPEPVEIGALMKECCDVLHTVIQRQRIELRIEIEAELGPLVVDPVRLKQALYNYLSNALKFTPAGGRIRLRALAEGQTRFRIEVEDNGIGIAAADLPRLFNDFEQLSVGHTKLHGGTGLGLALTRRLVQAQGGNVGVHSVQGLGSVFSLVMARQYVTGKPATDDKPEFSTALPAHRVLVIDDDERSNSRVVQELTAGGPSASFAVADVLGRPMQVDEIVAAVSRFRATGPIDPP